MPRFGHMLAMTLAIPVSVGAQQTELQALQDSVAAIESRMFTATNLSCEWGTGTFAEYEGVFGIETGPETGPRLS